MDRQELERDGIALAKGRELWGTTLKYILFGVMPHRWRALGFAYPF